MRLLWLLFAPALGYQLLAIAATLRHLLLPAPKPSPELAAGGISILKPLRGADPGMQGAFASHARQNFDRYEILFGVSDLNDPAAAYVRNLQSEYPHTDIRLILSTTDAPNRKVGVLVDLARQAKYPVWVVNDSDITVTPEYLNCTLAPLADPEVGLVTCLYRPRPRSLAATWEALGIATDFMPSILVAPLVGVREFGLGSTLVFRAADLEKAGGFVSLAEYLADDYYVGKRLTSLGKRAVLSSYIVETSLGEPSWIGVWQHQLRWSRTIRLTKGAGHAGLPFTFAGLWVLIAVLCGAWIPAALLLVARALSGLVAGVFVVRSSVAAGFFWLAPLWDLYAFAIWTASYGGREVRWRDRKLSIDSRGRIE